MYYQNDESVYSVFGQVLRFHYCRMHMLLEKEGVYPGQPPLLFALGKHDGLSQKELAEKLFIKPATITIMLNRMEKAKLIERRPDSQDLRISRVYLTELGKKTHQQVKDCLKTIEGELFYNFTTEEQLLLRKLFLQMRDNLKLVCSKSLNK